MHKKVTIYDISKASGVSACCVSWVLRDHPRSREVGAETRKRILETAKKMGYRRNQLASATRTGQVNTIAVIFDSSRHQNTSPFNQIMEGIMVEASSRCFSIKIFAEDDLDDSFKRIVENMIEKVIMLSVDADLRERAAELAEKYSLTLVYGYEHGHRNFPAVNVNNAAMTANMVRYLADCGHSRIGLLCVPHRKYHYVKDRHAGFLLGMEECGLAVDPDWISCRDDTVSAVREMLALPEERRPTAFVALSDTIAARVQGYAVRNNLRFPEDISVVSIGDTTIASLLPFPLTTMRESLTDTGNLLVRLVMKEAVPLHPDEFNVYQTRGELVERDSVCKLNKNIITE